MTDLMTLAVPGAELRLAPCPGMVTSLRFASGCGGWLSPLHCAPWLDEPQVQADPDIPLVERRLSGDFLCAPFGASSGAPLHGWSANSAWRVDELVQSDRAATARLELECDVQGARVQKEIHLHAGAPLLYQSHIVTGGRGALPVAHHPMIALQAGGRLSFSAKQLALTGDRPLEPGRNWLDYPAQTSDMARFPGGGGTVDLHCYPGGTGHEDFVTLVEARGHELGWTAVVRQAERDIVFFLKDPARLPVTMLWYSNGGRDYSPWNGRHRGVLGVEDGCTPGSGTGEAAYLAQRGVATHLELAPGRVHVIRHVIGTVPLPEGWSTVRDIRRTGRRLLIEGDVGAPLTLPLEAGFFAPAELV
ncbi:MAG: hypothetical protein WCD16_10800 [Paracoccaceae bacterium]